MIPFKAADQLIEAVTAALTRAAPDVFPDAREMAMLRQRIAYLEAGLDATVRYYTATGACLPTCASNLVADEDCDCGYEAAGAPEDFAAALLAGEADLDGAVSDV